MEDSLKHLLRSVEKLKVSLILFGSKASGEYFQGSDTDILIIIEDQETEVLKKLRGFASKSGINIDFHVYGYDELKLCNVISPTFLDEFELHHKVLIGKKPKLYSFEEEKDFMYFNNVAPLPVKFVLIHKPSWLEKGDVRFLRYLDWSLVGSSYSFCKIKGCKATDRKTSFHASGMSAELEGSYWKYRKAPQLLDSNASKSLATMALEFIKTKAIARTDLTLTTLSNVKKVNLEFVKLFPKQNLLSVMLYGSLSLNESNHGSDVDLLVVYKKLDIDTMTKLGKVVESYEKKGLLLSLLVYSLDELERGTLIGHVKHFSHVYFSMLKSFRLLYGTPLFYEGFEENVEEDAFKEGIRYTLRLKSNFSNLKDEEIVKRMIWIMRDILFVYGKRPIRKIEIKNQAKSSFPKLFTYWKSFSRHKDVENLLNFQKRALRILQELRC